MGGGATKGVREGRTTGAGFGLSIGREGRGAVVGGGGGGCCLIGAMVGVVVGGGWGVGTEISGCSSSVRRWWEGEGGGEKREWCVEKKERKGRKGTFDFLFKDFSGLFEGNSRTTMTFEVFGLSTLKIQQN